MTDRPVKVLIEHPDALVRLDLVEELEGAGFEVHACAGPAQRRCPLVTGEGCMPAEEADVIVNALGSTHLPIYLAQRVHLPETPVCIEIPDHPRGRLEQILAGVRAAGPLPMGSALCSRIHEAVERSVARAHADRTEA